MLYAFFAQIPARNLPAQRISPGVAAVNEPECVPTFFYKGSEKRCQGEILRAKSVRYSARVEITEMSSAAGKIYCVGAE